MEPVTMTAAEIDVARVEKSRFLKGFVVLVLANAATRLAIVNLAPGSAGVSAAAGLNFAAQIVFVVLTWRFSRALMFKVPTTLVQVVFAVVFAIIPVIVLIRFFGSRTGIPINFWMREKPKADAPSHPV